MSGVLYHHVVKTVWKVEDKTVKIFESWQFRRLWEIFTVLIVVMNAVEFMDAGNYKLFGLLFSEPFLTSQKYDVMDLFGWSKEKLLVLKETGYVDLGWSLCGQEQEFLFALCFLWRVWQNETCVGNLIWFYFVLFCSVFSLYSLDLGSAHFHPEAPVSGPCRAGMLNVEEICYSSVV